MDSTWIWSLLTAGIASTGILEFVFCTMLLFMFRIKLKILKMEEEQNSKFKTMFNAIQDAVVVVKSSSLKFINIYAKQLIGEAEKEVLNAPFLYLFDDSDETTQARRTK